MLLVDHQAVTGPSIIIRGQNDLGEKCSLGNDDCDEQEGMSKMEEMLYRINAFCNRIQGLKVAGFPRLLRRNCSTDKVTNMHTYTKVSSIVRHEMTTYI